MAQGVKGKKGFQPGNKIGNRIKKGEVYNPDGARAHKHNKIKRKISDELEKIGQELIIEKIQDGNGEEVIVTQTNFEKLMRNIYQFAHDGEAWAATFIAERTEGKITQQIGIEPPGEDETKKLLDAQKLEILNHLLKNPDSITDGSE